MSILRRPIATGNSFNFISLQCDVCFEDFTNDGQGAKHHPILLPSCGHNMCAKCVHQMFNRGTRRACVVCEEPIAARTISDLRPNKVAMRFMDPTLSSVIKEQPAAKDPTEDLLASLRSMGTSDESLEVLEHSICLMGQAFEASFTEALVESLC